MQSAIIGLGHYLPPEVDTVGVRRPIASEPIGASTLVARAMPAALVQAGGTVESIDFIVFATWTPDVTFPGAGCYLQAELGCDTVGALDIRGQCAGFLFGLSIADQFVRTGSHKHVVLAAAEVHSPGLDYSARGAAVASLFGDGAGVAIVAPAKDGGSGLKSVVIHSDGRHHREFWCEYPASRQHPRISSEVLRAGKHFPALDFGKVRDFGTQTLPVVIAEALDKADIGPDRIDRFIIGHVFPDVAHTVAAGMGIAPSRMSVPSAQFGHLGAAALPVALSRAVAAGEIGPGSTVCLAACGAGYAWGAAVLRL